MRRPVKHKRALIPAAIAAALLLTGCTTGSDVAPQGETKTSDENGCLIEGKASKAIEISGDFGGDVKIASKTPVSADVLQSSVVTEGDGAALEAGDQVLVSLSLFNGTSGKLLSHETPTLTNDKSAIVEWAYGSIACASVGDRVATVVPKASDVFGEGQVANTGLEGIEEEDPLIFVFDVKEILPKPLARAEGVAQEAPAGFPAVSLDDAGAPTITIPAADAPAELKIATLIEGSGDIVAETDQVTLNYTGVLWSNGSTFDSSWNKGQPITLGANQFVSGFSKAIIGAKVGSQIIAIIPAAEGYGDQTATRLSGAKADDVMVFVVDVLATVHTG